MDDHNRLSKMGYTHEKPKLKEDNTNDKSDDSEGMDKVQLLKKNLRMKK